MSEQNSTEQKPNGPEAPPREPVDQLVQTHHMVAVNGQELHYTVTTGTIILEEEMVKKGEKAGEAEGERPKAGIFFIAYTLDETTNLNQRPITFSFNGGPGSSSVWLHLGLLGPRRVYLDDEGRVTRPPFHLVDNEYSLLDVRGYRRRELA